MKEFFTLFLDSWSRFFSNFTPIVVGTGIGENASVDMYDYTGVYAGVGLLIVLFVFFYFYQKKVKLSLARWIRRLFWTSTGTASAGFIYYFIMQNFGAFHVVCEEGAGCPSQLMSFVYGFPLIFTLLFIGVNITLMIKDLLRIKKKYHELN